MDSSAKTVNLPGSLTLSIRRPEAQADLHKLAGFFSRLPMASRQYLRYDVTSLEACRRRLEQIDARNHWRLVAEMDDRIVGDATLDRRSDSWAHHVAEIRGVIDPEVRQPGIGQVLFGELVETASANGIELLVCEVLERDRERIETMESIGFAREAVLKNYARDLNDRLQDLIIMTIDLEDAWKCLLEQLEELDIRSLRNS
jgi:ribosomal protein S18 acetylase RimI-like enzyme